MKIYLIYSYYGIGGAQRRAANLAKKFAQAGYSVTILSLYGNDNSITSKNNYIIHDGIEMVSIPEYFDLHKEDNTIIRIRKKAYRKQRRLKLLQYALYKVSFLIKIINRKLRVNKNTLEIKSFFATNEPGIVICFGFNIFESVFYAAKKFHNKVIYAETNAIQKYINDKNYSDTRKLLKGASALVFQTQQQKEDLCIKNPLTFIISNPVSGELPNRVTGERRRIIVNFCALKRHKNLLLLVSAFKMLMDYENKYSQFQLWLYSDSTNQLGREKDDYRKEIMDFIIRNQLEKNVKLLTMDPHIHERIKDCYLFVSSSDYEGISNSMIEAMAIGLPCVCTDCLGGGAREMIIDHENGIIVPTGDANALFLAMKEMIDNPNLLRKCSDNAVKIKDKLSLERISNQWIKVLRQV